MTRQSMTHVPSRATAVLSVLALAATMALAQGKPPDTGGGGGNKPPTEAGFSLSVPAIMAVSVGGFPLTCPAEWSILRAPSKAPVYYDAACAETNDGVVCVDAGHYFVQRDAAWQAPCKVVSSVNAIGAWGDNLAGDAMLKVGSPIRVELVLWDNSGQSSGQQGYKVIKLEPAELDRVSDYGHLAVDNGDGTFSATPMDLGAIVHDPAATLKIERLSDMAVVFQGVAGGEINATGKIVYGYNLRVAEPGTYGITYTLPNVSLDGCEEAAAVCAGHTAYLEIAVAGGGGRGGGKGSGPGGGKPVKPLPCPQPSAERRRIAPGWPVPPAGRVALWDKVVECVRSTRPGSCVAARKW